MPTIEVDPMSHPLSEQDLEFLQALRDDVELLVEVARGAAKAAELQEQHELEERVAHYPATDPEVAARLKGAIARRRRAKAAADAISPLRVEQSGA